MKISTQRSAGQNHIGLRKPSRGTHQRAITPRRPGIATRLPHGCVCADFTQRDNACVADKALAYRMHHSIAGLISSGVAAGVMHAMTT